MPDQIDFTSRKTLEHTDRQFIERWSPRAFTRTPIPQAHLAAIVEAARWSPSCYNEQPWRIYTASQGGAFEQYLQVLNEANRNWAKDASVLGFIVAKQQFSHNGKANAHADFDAGSAWMSLSLQASNLGYHTHGMAGIDYEMAYQRLQLDGREYRVICAFALGVLADLTTLPDAQLEKEKPNQRRPLADIWMHQD